MVTRKVRIVVTFWEEDGDVIRRHVGELLGFYLMTSVVTTWCPFILLQTVHITLYAFRTMIFLTIRKKLKLKLKNICVSVPPVNTSFSILRGKSKTHRQLVCLPGKWLCLWGRDLAFATFPPSAPCPVLDLASPFLPTHNPFRGANNGSCAGDPRAESDPTVLLSRSSQLPGRDTAGTGVDNVMTTGR